MKVLMIAPQPWFSPRGTPISVLHRLRTVSKLGHEVDLLTYHLGEDVPIDRVNIIRIPKVPFVKKIAVGPSKIKIVLDLLLIYKAVRLLSKNTYDLIHSHEEAGFFSTYLARKYNTLHLYDMHSSLPQQLTNFKFTKLRFLINTFEKLERWTITNADAVITICPELFEYVQRLFPQKYQVLIENVADNSQIFENKPTEPQALREKYNLDDNIVILYAGTFEPYQGLDLLIESSQSICKQNPRVSFLLVGGNPQQVTDYQKLVQEHHLTDRFIFTGSVPPEQVPAFLEIADILVSPRIEGNNTPLKIYSYLRSGKPIVATRHITHTQVLNDEVAILTDCTPDSFAEGLRKLIDDKNLRRKLAKKAQKLAEEKYSYAAYFSKTKKVYDMLERKRIEALERN
ncbi:MAG: glycosyltransferase family 4 protein [candidate division KSB1 bacterium]|nr:glycosyltransferase family 4 protein [candidate division KSB1 bacterium]